MLENLPRTRDSMGRFVTGHENLSPGRRPREIEQQYLTTMESVVSGDVWKQICERAVLDALAGDARARSWLTDYLLGQPIARVQQVDNQEDPMTKFIREMSEEMREEALSLRAQGLELGEKYKSFGLVDDDE